METLINPNQIQNGGAVRTLNITQVGSPTISDNFIASGFSASNYLSFPIVSPEGNSWKVRVKFRFTQLSDTAIMDAPSDQENFRLGIGTNGLQSKELNCLFSAGGGWLNSGDYDLGIKYETANEWWWLEIGYNRTTEKLFVNKRKENPFSLFSRNQKYCKISKTEKDGESAA